MQLIIKHHPDDFKFKEPPYEYEYKKLPMDLILGSKELRKKLTNLENLTQISDQWTKELNEFKTLSGKYYLYD
jgi:uncharacterized protein YbbC (DUF1343 family)